MLNAAPLVASQIRVCGALQTEYRHRLGQKGVGVIIFFVVIAKMARVIMISFLAPVLGADRGSL